MSLSYYLREKSICSSTFHCFNFYQLTKIFNHPSCLELSNQIRKQFLALQSPGAVSIMYKNPLGLDFHHGLEDSPLTAFKRVQFTQHTHLLACTPQLPQPPYNPEITHPKKPEQNPRKAISSHPSIYLISSHLISTQPHAQTLKQKQGMKQTIHTIRTGPRERRETRNDKQPPPPPLTSKVEGS